MPWKHVSVAAQAGRLGLFCMLEAHDPQGTAGHVTAPEPSWQVGRIWSCRTRDGTGALPYREAGSGAMVHVVAPKQFPVGR
jgi:hypothetical protein